jgi:trehalose/maltose hydrolase-like predicted phosphorylase
MAVWLLLRAQDVLAVLPSTRRTELVESLGLGPAELLHWRKVSQRMYVPIGADGVISQFEGYRDLPELDWDSYRRRYGDIQRLDRILEAEGRSVDGCGDEVRDLQPDETVRFFASGTLDGDSAAAAG